jgi:DNA polymerase-3 subunit epsilon
MREIVFDTETTGFGVEEHRVIEIGCVELENRIATGRVYHTFINPQREIDFGATKVHGITGEKVATAPLFADVAQAVLDFFGDAPLVAHNAEFDFSFMNMEFGRMGLPPLANPMVDTLQIAKQKLPGQRHNLDALCRHYDVDNSDRTFHGALLDAQLLAEVYVELMGGLQASFGLEAVQKAVPVATVVTSTIEIAENTIVIPADEEELAAHSALAAKSGWKLWQDPEQKAE